MHSTLDRPIKLLYIEDEVDLRYIISLTFDMIDSITHIMKPNAEEALEYLKQNEVDAVVSDHYLPNMQGIDFLEIVKEKYPNIRRFMITGAIQASVYEDARKRADPEYIFDKPVVVDNIVEKLFEKY